MYKVDWTGQAEKDYENIKNTPLAVKLADMLNTVEEDPFRLVHRFEKIVLNKKLTIYTRRLNRQHRFVYTVEPNIEDLKDDGGKLYEGIVIIHRMWGHCP